MGTADAPLVAKLTVAIAIRNFLMSSSFPIELKQTLSPTFKRSISCRLGGASRKFAES
jgi:hypothetical protein